MSAGEVGCPAGLSGVAADDGVELLRLISQAVFGAMMEDWTAESLEQYWAAEGPVATRWLPDDTIASGTPLQRQLMRQLAGGGSLEMFPLTGLTKFLSLAVSGSRVLEDETAFCRVAWVSSGEVAEPVFSLAHEA